MYFNKTIDGIALSSNIIMLYPQAILRDGFKPKESQVRRKCFSTTRKLVFYVADLANLNKRLSKLNANMRLLKEFRMVEEIVLQCQPLRPCRVCKEVGRVDCVCWDTSGNNNYTAEQCRKALMRLFQGWVDDGRREKVPSIEVVGIPYRHELRENRKLKSIRTLFLQDK